MYTQMVGGGGGQYVKNHRSRSVSKKRNSVSHRLDRSGVFRLRYPNRINCDRSILFLGGRSKARFRIVRPSRWLGKNVRESFQ